MQGVYNIVSPRAEGKGLELTIEIDPVVPKILRSDATKLRQILVNLMGNAIKFTPSGQVSLSAKAFKQEEQQVKSIQFSVIDTGVGIAKDKQGHIFDAFKQVQDGIDVGGTGLGLAISRHLTQALGCSEITVQSEQGQGSTFEFVMPLLDVDQNQIIVDESDYTAQEIPCLQVDQEIQVLVVDDRKTNREILSGMLTAAGFIAKQAENGQQALDLAKDFQFELILMDIMMPVMDGLQATAMLRQEPTYTDVPILGVTANVAIDMQEKVTAAGCNDLLSKPIRVSELFDKIGQYMAVQFQSAGEKHVAMHNVDGHNISMEEFLEPNPELDDFIDIIRTASEMGDIAELDHLLGVFKGEFKAPTELSASLEKLIKNFDFDKIKKFANGLKEQRLK